eukprot:4802815-Amphidinium_carterae.1
MRKFDSKPRNAYKTSPISLGSYLHYSIHAVATEWRLQSYARLSCALWPFFGDASASKTPDVAKQQKNKEAEPLDVQLATKWLSDARLALND